MDRQTRLPIPESYEDESICLAPCIPIVCEDCPFGELGSDLDSIIENHPAFFAQT